MTRDRRNRRSKPHGWSAEQLRFSRQRRLVGGENVEYGDSSDGSAEENNPTGELTERSGENEYGGANEVAEMGNGGDCMKMGNGVNSAGEDSGSRDSDAVRITVNGSIVPVSNSTFHYLRGLSVLCASTPLGLWALLHQNEY